MAEVFNIQAIQRRIQDIESNGNQKVCVISIVGRGHLDAKDAASNQLADHHAFKTSQRVYNGVFSRGSGKEEATVKFFYDEEQKTVFLQLQSVYDAAQLTEACKQMYQNLTSMGCHHYWQGHVLKNAAALLFMFSVSHIVVVLFPTPRFDLTYLRLFKLLASTRYNMLHSLSQSLSQVEGIPEIWRTTGRPCIPRIIFSFQIPWGNAKGLNEASVRKLQQALQEQVHLILKKNRLLGSLSSSSLFTVSSPNQFFVHVQTPQRAHVDPVLFNINHILKNSINIDLVYSSLQTKISQASFVSQPSPTKADADANNSARNDLTLREFLYKQIDYMMTVESRDVPAEGRRGTHVEAPSIGLWYRVCEVVYDYFLGKNAESGSHVKGLSQSLDLDWKFSENRCRKVMPLATNAYLDNLPSHYRQAVHLSQLSQCLRTFAANARGPAYEHFAAQLEDDCNQVWWNGRHLCEVTSMTGQPCVYPYHNVPDGRTEGSEEKTGIPSKFHSSRVTSVSACNCGRTQGTREDPFDLKAANFDFYQDLSKKCCAQLVALTLPCFPVDEPSVKARSEPSLQKRLETHQITILKPDQRSSLSQLPGVPSQSQPSKQAEVKSSSEAVLEDASVLAANKEYSGDEKESLPQLQVVEGPDASGLACDSDVAKVDPSISSTISVPLAPASEIKESVAGEPAIESSELSVVGFQASSIERDDAAEYFLSVDAQRTRTQSFSLLTAPEGDIADKEDANTQDLPSALEYFEGMFTTDLPLGLLPLFNSWSLHIIGPASSYSLQKGVEQPGFFQGSNFLLSWDIPVRLADVSTGDEEIAHEDSVDSQEEQWPAPGEVMKQPSLGPALSSSSYLPLYQSLIKVSWQASELMNISKQPLVGKMKRPGSKELSSLRAYIGQEYECPRGHRFFCSAPDKMIKALASGHVRENASKLVTSDMPLYFPCPCRSSKPLHLAQLTRTFVVTPDSPCAVTLNPRVQPGDKSVTPTFYAGLKDGISLPPNSYCVLRYPYIYFGTEGPILPPPPTQPLLTCRVLKGVFSYACSTSYDE